MKAYRASFVAALPLVASLVATSATAQTVCNWYGFAVPRSDPVAADVVISSTSDYNAWATANGKRVARLHFQSQCRVTAQVDPGLITAVPAAIRLQDSSGIVESSKFTVTFYTPRGAQFDQVVFQSVYQKYLMNAMMTTDPIVGHNETRVHLPVFIFDAHASRKGLPITLGFGSTPTYEIYCTAYPVIPNLYGYQTVYSSETGRATRLYASSGGSPEPVSYSGNEPFPEQSLWNAAIFMLRRFDPDHVNPNNVKLDPSQLKGRRLGWMYYMFNLARNTACYGQ